MSAPLRILLVSEGIPAPLLGGLGKHVITLARALREAGHEVMVMGRDRPSWESCQHETRYDGPFLAGFADPERGWKERATGCFNPWKRPYAARQLARAIEAAAPGYDVVHYHGHLPLVARYVSPQVPLLQTRHDQGGDCITHVRFRQGEVCRETDPRACARCAHPQPGPLRTALSAHAVRRYRRETAQGFARHPVIFVSEVLRSNFLRAVPEADLSRSAVVHNFVREADLPPQAAEVQPVLHVAGRLDVTKGIGALLDLLVPRLSAPWTVRVFGDGPEAPALRQRHAGPAVSWQGHRPVPEVLAGLQASAATIVPSVWEEPCATVILEGLRMGKPCFALRRGGTPELLRYGAPGQLRLFDSLPQLVDGLTAALPGLRDVRGGESADVRQQLPALLALYRQRQRRA